MKHTYDEFGALHIADQLICEDIRAKGESEGWTGDVETFKALQSRLDKKGVEYKYLGTWKSKAK